MSDKRALDARTQGQIEGMTWVRDWLLRLSEKSKHADMADEYVRRADDITRHMIAPISPPLKWRREYEGSWNTRQEDE